MTPNEALRTLKTLVDQADNSEHADALNTLYNYVRVSEATERAYDRRRLEAEQYKSAFEQSEAKLEGMSRTILVLGKALEKEYAKEKTV